MTQEHKILSDEFYQYEKTRGFSRYGKVRYIIKVFIEYIELYGMSIYEISTKEAQNYQTYLTTLTKSDGSIHYATTTITDIIAVTKNFYDFLKFKRAVMSNPFKTIRLLKKENKLPRNIPEEKELVLLLKFLKEFRNQKHLRSQRFMYRTHIIGEVMYSTGMRIDEVSNITESDIDFENNIIIIRNGKGSRERIAYLNEYTAKILKIYIKDMKEVIQFKYFGDNIFGIKNGKVLDSSLNKYLNMAGKELNIGRFTSHNFRHCLGFHLLRRGCDLRYIQLILGHNDLKSTTIYTKVDKSDLRSELDKYHPRQFSRGDNE